MFPTTPDARPLTPAEQFTVNDLTGPIDGVAPTDMGVTPDGELVAELPDEARWDSTQDAFILDGRTVDTIGVDFYYLGERLTVNA